LDNHATVKVVQASSTCTGTDHVGDIITGGGQGGGTL
jgi:hypothetical protein